MLTVVLFCRAVGGVCTSCMNEFNYKLTLQTVSCAKMFIWCVALLLIGQGFSQCFNDTICNETVVSATDKFDCCVDTNDGLAWKGDSCSECVGKSGA